MQRLRFVLITGGVISLFLVLLVVLSVIRIPEHYVGVVVRDGVVVGTAEPGVNFVHPFLSNVRSIPITPQDRQVEGLSSASRDNYALEDGIVEYTFLVPADQAMDVYVKRPDYESAIASAITQHTKNVVGQYLLAEVPENRGQIEEEIRLAVAGVIEEEVGIEILNVTFAYYDWEAQAREVLADAQEAEAERRRAETQLDTARLELQREEEAAESRREMERLEAEAAAERRRIEAESEAQAEITRAQAEVESTRLRTDARMEELELLAQIINDAPRMTEVLWYEQWDGGLPQILGNSDDLDLALRRNVDSLAD